MGCGTSAPFAAGGAPSSAAASAPLTILIVGLDNSGKTTFAASVNGDAEPIIVPTVGFSSPTKRKVKGQSVTFYDLGGGARIRAVWPQYFADVHGVVFVVDAADPARFEEARRELGQALLHPMVVGKPLLVLANKADLAGAAGVAAMAEALQLDAAAVLCRHTVVQCSAKAVVAGAGGSAGAGAGARAGAVAQGLPLLDARIGLGLEWLVEAIRTDWAALEERRRREQAEHKKNEEEARRERLRRIQDDAAAADEAKKLRAAAVAAVSAAGNASSVASAAPAPAPAAAAPLCTVCKAAPAVRRCAAAGWEAVCDPCGVRAEARLAGASSASAGADEGNGSGSGAAAGVVAGASAGADGDPGAESDADTSRNPRSLLADAVTVVDEAAPPSGPSSRPPLHPSTPARTTQAQGQGPTRAEAETPLLRSGPVSPSTAVLVLAETPAHTPAPAPLPEPAPELPDLPQQPLHANAGQEDAGGLGAGAGEGAAEDPSPWHSPMPYASPLSVMASPSSSLLSPGLAAAFDEVATPAPARTAPVATLEEAMHALGPEPPVADPLAADAELTAMDEPTVEAPAATEAPAAEAPAAVAADGGDNGVVTLA